MIAGSVGISESSGYQSGSNAYKKGDFVTALQHWTIAAQKGEVVAQFNVATMHFKGRGTPKNDRIAVKWYTLAAKQGYANAQFSLGLMYYNGNGVPTDADSAIKWYTLAAKQGNASVPHNLGFMYRTGMGVLKDTRTALKWYKAAAKQGNPESERYLRMSGHRQYVVSTGTNSSGSRSRPGQCQLAK